MSQDTLIKETQIKETKLGIQVDEQTSNVTQQAQVGGQQQFKKIQDSPFPNQQHLSSVGWALPRAAVPTASCKLDAQTAGRA